MDGGRRHKKGVERAETGVKGEATRGVERVVRRGAGQAALRPGIAKPAAVFQNFKDICRRKHLRDPTGKGDKGSVRSKGGEEKAVAPAGTSRSWRGRAVPGASGGAGVLPLVASKVADG